MLRSNKALPEVVLKTYPARKVGMFLLCDCEDCGQCNCSAFDHIASTGRPNSLSDADTNLITFVDRSPPAILNLYLLDVRIIYDRKSPRTLHIKICF